MNLVSLALRRPLTIVVSGYGRRDDQPHGPSTDAPRSNRAPHGSANE
jgi:hypothetical protein